MISVPFCLQQTIFFDKSLPRLHLAMRGMVEALGEDEAKELWKERKPKTPGKSSKATKKTASASVMETPVKPKTPRSLRKKLDFEEVVDLNAILDTKVVVDKALFRAWLGQLMDVDVRLRDRLFIVQVGLILVIFNQNMGFIS